MSERRRISEVTLEDDRGRKVVARFEAQNDTGKEWSFWEAREMLWITTPWGGVRTLLLSCVVLVPATLSTMWIRPHSRAMSDGVLFISVVVVVFALFWAVLGHRLRASRCSELLSAARKYKRCPACCYDLGVCVAAADGCTVCPECGGAWKVSKASGM